MWIYNNLDEEKTEENILQFIYVFYYDVHAFVGTLLDSDQSLTTYSPS